MIRILSVVLVFITINLPSLSQDVKKWEETILQFEKRDVGNPVKKNGVVFAGSSSVVMWKTLEEDFKGINVINRGFGGSCISDLVYYVDRVILVYKPSQVFIYSGENDIAFGAAPEEVLNDFKILVKRIQEKLPACRIHYISIKPSPSRRIYQEDFRKANFLIESFIKNQNNPKLKFINVFDAMLDDIGRPRPALFIADSLHMNQDGYKIWKGIVGSYLK
ncbi:MAG: GDSL-type esterase/lipase family protein [Cytophagaceae bacterium]